MTHSNEVSAMSTDADTRKTALRLLVVSFITLFLELMIIRWVPASIRLIAYYANLMLISSFLGIGIGALLQEKRLNLFRLFPLIMLVDVVFLLICRKITLPGFSLEYRFLSVSPTVANFSVVIGIFILNTLVFVPLGEKIGQLFNMLPPLRAYAWDLGGSLMGTVAFGLFSLMFFSPSLGILVIVVVYMFLIPSRQRWEAMAPLLVSLVCIYLSTAPGAIWSPYYYVTIDEVGKAKNIRIQDVPENILTMVDPPVYLVRVNQDFLQLHRTINIDRYTAGTEKYKYALKDYNLHSLPQALRPSPENVLVVGAGGGNDVEAALLAGAKRVDAVEIDPVLVKIAKRINASGVYFDPRVNMVINDARAFFVNARPMYDQVIFGYLDSQALFSSKSTIRLDGFVYTVESFRKAYQLLKEDGLLSVSFAAGNDWIIKKLSLMLKEATGKMPVIYTLGGTIEADSGPVKLYVSRGRIDPPAEQGYFKRVALPPSLEERGGLSLATDDWPFLYLKAQGFPRDYLAVIIVLLAIASLAVFRAARIEWRMPQTHFFFLGAGFLLLETKSITDCSLYFGTTWFVTMLVITGILLMVLGANLITMHFLRSFRHYFYLPLLASMALLYVTPSDAVLGLSFTGRLAWVLVMVPLPIFFAGLIFSTTFRETTNASSAFGANLIGATIGGFAEYLCMIFGLQKLSLLVIAAYLASMGVMVLIRRGGQAQR